MYDCNIPQNKFKALSDIATKKNNGLFIFAHFLVPHPPFLMNSMGECLNARSITKLENLSMQPLKSKAQYLEYLQYFNNQILKIFDAILESNKNFIFVIQSDEGPYPCHYSEKCSANWDLKTGNINAFYSSYELGIDENDLKTPINNFLYIYKYILGAEINALEHASFKNKVNKEGAFFAFQEINDK
jgi:hypothetical protein